METSRINLHNQFDQSSKNLVGSLFSQKKKRGERKLGGARLFAEKKNPVPKIVSRQISTGLVELVVDMNFSRNALDRLYDPSACSSTTLDMYPTPPPPHLIGTNFRLSRKPDPSVPHKTTWCMLTIPTFSACVGCFSALFSSPSQSPLKKFLSSRRNFLKGGWKRRRGGSVTGPTHSNRLSI